MNFNNCPHYDEISTLLTEGVDLECISFEIDDIRNCTHCDEGGVCGLWIALAFVEDMKPQMGLEDPKVTIETLREQMSKVVLQLVRDISKNRNDNG